MLNQLYLWISSGIASSTKSLKPTAGATNGRLCNGGKDSVSESWRIGALVCGLKMPLLLLVPRRNLGMRKGKFSSGGSDDEDDKNSCNLTHTHTHKMSNNFLFNLAVKSITCEGASIRINGSSYLDYCRVRDGVAVCSAVEELRESRL